MKKTYVMFVYYVDGRNEIHRDLGYEGALELFQKFGDNRHIASLGLHTIDPKDHIPDPEQMPVPWSH